MNVYSAGPQMTGNPDPRTSAPMGNPAPRSMAPMGAPAAQPDPQALVSQLRAPPAAPAGLQTAPAAPRPLGMPQPAGPSKGKSGAAPGGPSPMGGMQGRGGKSGAAPGGYATHAGSGAADQSRLAQQAMRQPVMPPPRSFQ